MTTRYREDAETWRCFCPGCDAEEFLQVEEETPDVCILWCRSCASTSELRPGILITPVLIEQGSDEDDQRKPPNRLEVQLAVALARGQAVHERRKAGRMMQDAAFDEGVPIRSARRCLAIYYKANPDVEQVLYIDTDAVAERDDALAEMVNAAEPGDGTDWLTVSTEFGIDRVTARRAYERSTGKSASGIFKRSQAYAHQTACVPRDIHHAA